MASPVSDSLELLLLMGGGGLLSIFGFWLMLREGPGGGGAQIAFGGLQVPAASVGFAVFFGGLATFSAPIVAPNTTHEVMVRIAPASLRPGDGDPASSMRAGGRFAPDDEPRNDQMEGATLLEAGQLLGGTHSGEDVDWYEIELAAPSGGRIEVDMAGNGRGCRASFFDSDRQYFGLEPLARGRNELRLDPIVGDRIFVRLDCMESESVASYTIAYDTAAR